jgi:putative nucleotidyltransferase with HDIG domain
VVVLGFRAVRSAALALGVFEYFGGESSDGLDMRRFWTHSIGVAGVAKVLAEQTRTTPPEEAFVVGLLHDIGKLVQKRCFPGDFAAVAEAVQAGGTTWLAAEQRLLAVDHARMARCLFRTWQVPAPVVEAVGYHHRPDRAADPVQLAVLANLADNAAYELDLRGLDSEPPGLAEPELLRLLDIELPVPPEVEERIRAEVERSLAILELLDLA